MISEIKRYFDLLEQLVADEYQRDDEFDQQFSRSHRWFSYLKVACATCVMIGLFLWVLVSLIKLPWLKGVDTLFLALAFLIGVITLIYVSSNKGSGLAIARYCGEVDNKYLSLLSDLSKQTLELGCLELRHQSNWLLKVFIVMGGVISKLGLIPSLLSLVALYAIPNKVPEWVTPLVCVCGLFYWFSFLAQERLVRVERMIALTELAIKLKSQ